MFLSGWRDPEHAARVQETILAPGSRLIAVDPVSYLEAVSLHVRAEPAGLNLPRSSLESLDASEVERLRRFEAQGPKEPITGQNLGYLMVRSVLFRAIPFAKSLAVAESAVSAADRVVLVGSSMTPPGLPYPSEFHDLYPILEVIARRDGLPCEKVAPPDPAAPPAPGRSFLDLPARLEASLLRIRPRRVVAVELYQGVRARLSELMPGVSISPFVAPAPSRRDREAARALSPQFPPPRGELSAQGSDPLVEHLRSRALREAVAEDLPKVLARARAMASLLRTLRPHVVLLMEDVSPSGRALATLARRAGTWTAVVQHGLTGEGLGGIHVMPCIAHVHCAWGPYAAEWNYAHGAPPGSQVVIGDPMLDAAFAGGWPPAPDAPPRVVVFASQPFVGLSTLESDFHRTEVLRALLPLEAEGFPMIVKPHPNDSLPALKSIASALGFTAVQWDTTLEQSLRRPAVVVTRTSTVALEAMLRSRPVVLAALAGRGDRTGLSRHGAALLAATPEELTECVRSCLVDPSVRVRLAEGRAQLLREYLDGMDGKATARLADHVRSHLPDGRS